MIHGEACLILDLDDQTVVVHQDLDGRKSFLTKLRAKNSEEAYFPGLLKKGRVFEGLSTLEVVRVRDGVQETLPFSSTTLDGLARFIRGTSWGYPLYDCRDFTWETTGFDADRWSADMPFPFKEVADDENLDLGGVVAVGNLASDSVFQAFHWGVGLGDRTVLNIMGEGGFLASSPIDSLPQLYGGKVYSYVGEETTG